MSEKVPLIIPVENQVRELDPKLLLACVAVRRGFTCIVGSHRKIDLGIASLPKSVYLCKSFTARNLAMFRIMHRLGHRIVSWDEEALVHLPADMYFARRLSPASLRYVSRLFAWGDDNARLWRRYPQMPGDKPIHITGNPRGDLLRPELRAVYAEDAARLRRTYGDIILVNTNFNHVNAFAPQQNLFRPPRREGEKAPTGKAATGMSREFAEALRRHKQTLFDHFKAIIPALDAAFPNCTVVVRPHPTENPDVYHRIAARCRRVRVINEGNVVPWLIASRVLLHNGCTTAVEAYGLGVPTVSYRPCVNEAIDRDFYRLPNHLSHQCFSDVQVQEVLGRILRGELSALEDTGRQVLLHRHVEAQSGPLASERMVDVLEAMVGAQSGLSRFPLLNRAIGVWQANARRGVKWAKRYLPGSHAPPEFHRHRYPGIGLGELRRRIACFQRALGDNTEFETQAVADQVFCISRRVPGIE
jgi:surface carbohydrate biosynthesis protein